MSSATAVRPETGVVAGAEPQVCAATARSALRSRNDALDFVKGALVVAMVVYHWMNYFVTVTWDPYRYLRFLTPSFIFITGFIVSHVYAAQFGRAPGQTTIRLWRRGAKLLALFTVLNVVASALISTNYDGRRLGVGAFFSNAQAIYVTGDGRALFNVLVPIAYFLLAAPMFLALQRQSRAAVPTIVTAVLVAAWVAAAYGHSSVNFELLALAALGVFIGTVPIERLAHLAAHRGLIVAAYAVYLAAVTLWNVRFPIQVAGVCLSLMLLFTLALAAGAAGTVPRAVITLGRYSLVGYIGQVAILQVLRRALPVRDAGGWVALLAFVLALLLTTAGTLTLDALRRRNVAVDRAYRLVFA